MEGSAVLSLITMTKRILITVAIIIGVIFARTLFSYFINLRNESNEIITNQVENSISDFDSSAYFTKTENKARLVTDQATKEFDRENYKNLEHWDYYYSTLKNSNGKEIIITYYGYHDGINSIDKAWKIEDEDYIQLYKDFTNNSYLERFFDSNDGSHDPNLTLEEQKNVRLLRLKYYETNGYLVSIRFGHEPVLAPESVLIID